MVNVNGFFPHMLAQEYNNIRIQFFDRRDTGNFEDGAAHLVAAKIQLLRDDEIIIDNESDIYTASQSQPEAPPVSAFDGDDDTFWLGNSGGSGLPWLGAHLASERIANRMQSFKRSENHPSDPCALEIQVPDGSGGWVACHRCTSDIHPGVANEKAIDIYFDQKPKDRTDFRLTLLDNNRADLLTAIGGFELIKNDSNIINLDTCAFTADSWRDGGTNRHFSILDGDPGTFIQDDAPWSVYVFMTGDVTVDKYRIRGRTVTSVNPSVWRLERRFNEGAWTEIDYRDDIDTANTDWHEMVIA